MIHLLYLKNFKIYKMKKILPLLLFPVFSLAQTAFNSGFNDGYKGGYCYDKGLNCQKPIPPIAPIPNANEKSTSYYDGYNRGFAEGLNKSKEAETAKYKTSSGEFVEDKMYNPYQNVNNVIQLAMLLKESKGVAITHLEDGNYQAVANICYAGLKVSPKDSEFMLLLAQAYRDSDNLEQALKWYKKAYQYRRGDNNLKELIKSLEK